MRNWFAQRKEKKLLPRCYTELTEAVIVGRTRHFTDITAEGEPGDDEETVVEDEITDVRLVTQHKIRDPRGARGRDHYFTRPGL